MHVGRIPHMDLGPEIRRIRALNAVDPRIIASDLVLAGGGPAQLTATAVAQIVDAAPPPVERLRAFATAPLTLGGPTRRLPDFLTPAAAARATTVPPQIPGTTMATARKFSALNISLGGIARGAIGAIGSVVADIIPGRFDDILIDAITGQRSGGGSGPCEPGFVRSSTGACVNIGSPKPGAIARGQRFLPGGETGLFEGNGSTGLPSPVSQPTTRFRCPPFRNGSVGVIYFSPETNRQVCLPKSSAAGMAKAMGLIRKWPARKKPFITNATVKAMRSRSSGEKKAKELAKLAGLVAHKKGAHSKKK